MPPKSGYLPLMVPFGTKAVVTVMTTGFVLAGATNAISSPAGIPVVVGLAKVS